jgi:mannose-6-phosphate isomerase
MGTYPSLPSKVLETDEDLQDVLDKHSNELIGQNVIQKFSHTKLPYLPKILSIAKALPLQLHPVRQNHFSIEEMLTPLVEQGPCGKAT